MFQTTNQRWYGNSKDDLSLTRHALRKRFDGWSKSCQSGSSDHHFKNIKPRKYHTSSKISLHFARQDL